MYLQGCTPTKEVLDFRRIVRVLLTSDFALTRPRGLSITLAIRGRSRRRRHLQEDREHRTKLVERRPLHRKVARRFVVVERSTPEWSEMLSLRTVFRRGEPQPSPDVAHPSATKTPHSPKCTFLMTRSSPRATRVPCDSGKVGARPPHPHPDINHAS